MPSHRPAPGQRARRQMRFGREWPRGVKTNARLDAIPLQLAGHGVLAKTQ